LCLSQSHDVSLLHATTIHPGWEIYQITGDTPLGYPDMPNLRDSSSNHGPRKKNTIPTTITGLGPKRSVVMSDRGDRSVPVMLAIE